METRKGTGSLDVGILDLSSLDYVRQFAEAFIREHKKLNLLINNAGVATPPESKTSEGYHSQKNNRMQTQQL